jgi:hypothetical protein
MASSDLISQADTAAAQLEQSWNAEQRYQDVSGTVRTRGEWQEGVLSKKRFFDADKPPFVVSSLGQLIPHSLLQHWSSMLTFLQPLFVADPLNWRPSMGSYMRAMNGYDWGLCAVGAAGGYLATAAYSEHLPLAPAFS